MKVVINRCYGGFGLSDVAFEKLLDRKGIAWEKKKDRYSYDAYYHAGHLDDNDYYLSDYKFYGDRTDKDLLAVIEEMGEASFGEFANLQIVNIPDDVEFEIEKYDGMEWVAEKHRTWS